MNKPESRAQPIVSLGGIGSANSLAKFYAMLANDGQIEGREFFSEKTIGWMATTLTDGIDRVFQVPTAFSAGFMKDSEKSARKRFGRSTRPPVRLGPFGHPGAGGSNGFADPENKISFAYVMNQMEQSVLPNEKSLRLVEALYRPLAK
jgi:CubicO group peptidase (beta-lactamase class C family)